MLGLRACGCAAPDAVPAGSAAGCRYITSVDQRLKPSAVYMRDGRRVVLVHVEHHLGQAAVAQVPQARDGQRPAEAAALPAGVDPDNVDLALGARRRVRSGWIFVQWNPTSRRRARRGRSPRVEPRLGLPEARSASSTRPAPGGGKRPGFTPSHASSSLPGTNVRTVTPGREDRVGFGAASGLRICHSARGLAKSPATANAPADGRSPCAHSRMPPGDSPESSPDQLRRHALAALSRMDDELGG